MGVRHRIVVNPVDIAEVAGIQVDPDSLRYARVRMDGGRAYIGPVWKTVRESLFMGQKLDRRINSRNIREIDNLAFVYIDGELVCLFKDDQLVAYIEAYERRRRRTRF